MMNNPPPEIQRLVVLWQQRLRDARLQYDFARNYVTEVQHELQSGALPSPDGSYAYQLALRKETYALAAYRETLKIFTAFILDGQVPDERNWPPHVHDVADE